MPYQKSGLMNDMPKKKRVIIIVAAALVTVAAVLAIWYAASPRAFLKTFLTKPAYAKTVLYKNGKEELPTAENALSTLTKKQAWNIQGSTNVQPSEEVNDELKSDLAAEQFQTYMSSLTFDTDLQLDKGHFKTTTALADGDGSLFTIGVWNAKNGMFANVDEVNSGWFRLTSAQTDSSASSDKGLDTRAKTALASDDKTVKKGLYSALYDGYKAVKGDILFREDEEMTFGVDTKTATGARTTIVLDRSNAVGFIKTAAASLSDNHDLFLALDEQLDDDDRFNTEDNYKSYIAKKEKELLNAVDDSGVSKVSVELYVNKRNEITGFDVLVKRTNGDLELRAVLDDDKDSGMAVLYKKGQATVLDVDWTEKSDSKGTVNFNLGTTPRTITYKNLEKNDEGRVYGTFELASTTFTGKENLGSVAAILTMKPDRNSEDGVSAGLQLTSSTLGQTLISSTIKPAKAEGVSSPTAGQITNTTMSKVLSSMASTMMGTIRDTHPSFDRLVDRVSQAYMTTYFSNLIAEATGS